MPEIKNFPQLSFSKKAVRQAGEALKNQLHWTPGNEEEVIEIFRIASNWRDSHAFPMNRMKAELHGRMGALRLKGLTAARLKRMPSIRNKLRRLSGNLSQIQDLGGCRAVVTDMCSARLLVESIKQQFPHELIREDAYMDKPRESGYRSHHLVFSFEPRNVDESELSGRRIELQIRSRLQHSWATAVETVGLFVGDDFKGGFGDENWLRLFELMSAEIAYAEGCNTASDSRRERVGEIKQLSDQLNAVQMLDTLSVAASDSERRYFGRFYKPKFCLIKFDRSARNVEVDYFDNAREIALSYGSAEEHSLRATGNHLDIVVVELDKIEDLKDAYPNYFGDVRLFKNNLTEIVEGGEVREYQLPPIETVPPPPKAIPDDSWLRYPSRRKWNLSE